MNASTSEVSFTVCLKLYLPSRGRVLRAEGIKCECKEWMLPQKIKQAQNQFSIWMKKHFILPPNPSQPSFGQSLGSIPASNCSLPVDWQWMCAVCVMRTCTQSYSWAAEKKGVAGLSMNDPNPTWKSLVRVRMVSAVGHMVEEGQ